MHSYESLKSLYFRVKVSTAIKIKNYDDGLKESFFENLEVVEIYKSLVSNIGFTVGN